VRDWPTRRRGFLTSGFFHSDEVAKLAADRAAVKLPVIADATPDSAGRRMSRATVRELRARGLAGLHLEDQEFPKPMWPSSRQVDRAVDEMVEKNRIASGRAERFRFSYHRADGFARGRRCRCRHRARTEYLEAGPPTGFFPRRFRQRKNSRPSRRALKHRFSPNDRVRKGPLLSVEDWQPLDTEWSSFRRPAFRVGSKARLQCLQETAKNRHAKAWLDRMQTREELYKLCNTTRRLTHGRPRIET